MAQSFSDYSVGSESDSSREETIYDTIRATAAKPGSPRTEESPGPTLVIRIIIQDLQQTVSPRPAGPRARVRDRRAPRGASAPTCPPAGSPPRALLLVPGSPPSPAASLRAAGASATLFSEHLLRARAGPGPQGKRDECVSEGGSSARGPCLCPV